MIIVRFFFGIFAMRLAVYTFVQDARDTLDQIPRSFLGKVARAGESVETAEVLAFQKKVMTTASGVRTSPDSVVASYL